MLKRSRVNVKESSNNYIKLTLKGIDIDEFFLYEYNRCQYRSTKSFNRVRTKVGKYDSKTYCTSDTSLVYEIYKKTLAISAGVIDSAGLIDLEKYKLIVQQVTEKVIFSNQKIYKKSKQHYDLVRRDVNKRIRKNFEIINQYDFYKPNEKFIKINFKFSNLFEHFEAMVNRRKGLYPYIKTEDLPNIKFDIFSKFSDRFNNNYVVSSTLCYIDEDYIHRNLYISLILNYFKYLGDPKYNKVVLYDFLRHTRKVYDFSQIYGKIQLIELMRMCSSIQNRGSSRTSDNAVCLTCENNRGCMRLDLSGISNERIRKMKSSEIPKVLI